MATAKKNTRLPFILALSVVAVWGETFVSTKVLLTSGLLPADIFTLRFVLAYVCLIMLSHRKMWAESLKDEFLLFLAGVMGGSMYFLTENMALEYSTASNVAILVSTTPLVTSLLLAVFYKDERLRPKQIAGSAIAFVGVILVVMNGRFLLHVKPLGDLLAIAASFSWGVYSLCMKPLAGKYDVKFITRKVFGYGLVTILPWFAFVHPLNLSLEVFTQPKVYMNLIYLGLVASLICFLVWNWALPRVGIVKATNMVYVQPIFTMVVASVVLGEEITWMALLGATIIISGMLLAER